MSKITYRVILVIGDDHEAIAKKYSADTNPNGYYKYERCQQHRLEVTGEEGDFSDPFPLKDGTLSYSAHYNDINWKLIHRNSERIKTYERLWELAVENSQPNDKWEESLVYRFKNRKEYFDNFLNKKEYLNHTTSLWYWGVATEEKYEEVDEEHAKEWVADFFDTYIKPLEKTNPLITIYETHSLD